MADTSDTVQLSPNEHNDTGRTKQHTPPWSRIALGSVLLVSLFMDFFQLGQNGFGNLYYAAGVRSMTDSIQNFFFVSLDPGGFVAVDKPPLGFWLQTVSAKLLGFTPLSIFLPQALCGVLSVFLLYSLVRRHFGVVAGLVAALALAVSPISVITNRNNTIDSTLAFIMLLAAGAVIRAAETGKLRWLLLSGVFVGLGFNTKMAEAYLIIPPLVMTYLLCAPRKVWTRIWHLALFIVVCLALSLSWLVIVDLVPPSQRPYVGSTPNNSAVGLAFGYNGISRFRINGDTFSDMSNTGSSKANARVTRTDRTAKTNTSQRTAPPANITESGIPGPLRLVGPSLGGQVGWLLPFALIAIVVLIVQRRPRFRSDRQQLGLVLWGFWLLTMAAFFSLDGSFHVYYMVIMAPGLSALVGIGMAIMWQDYRSTSWRGWLLPFALIVTAITQIYILKSYPVWLHLLGRPIEGFAIVVVLALMILRLLPLLRLQSRLKMNGSAIRAESVATGIGLLMLLLAPTVWASYSVFQNTEAAFFTAGPSYNDTSGKFFSTGQPVGQNSLSQNYALLVMYLLVHQGNTKFLVATVNAATATPIILATNKPVMALGGYSGNDPILTTSKLQTLISNGTVRYFLLNVPRSVQRTIDELPKQYRARFQDGNLGQQGKLTAWVITHCNTVPASDWSSPRRAGNAQLYDCAAV